MKGSMLMYLKNNQFFMHPLLSTNSGALFMEPVFVKDFSLYKEEIGMDVLKVLSHSKEGDFPKLLKDGLRPLLKAAKVRSYSSFISQTKLISIGARDTFIYIIPSKNNGSKNGFGYLWEKRIELPIDSDEKAIGEAVLKAFELAE